MNLNNLFLPGYTQEEPDVFTPSGIISAANLPVSGITIQQQKKSPISDDLYKKLTERKLQSFKDQAAGVKEFEGSIQDPKAVDPTLAVISGLSDFFSGTNYLQGLYGQKAAQEKQAREDKFKLQQMKQNLTDKEIDMLKNQFQYQQEADQLKAQMGLAREKIAAETRKRNLTTDRDILKTKESQKIQAQINLKNAIDEYQTLLEEKGYQFKGEDADKLESTYADLKIKYKEAANLGALTGPDVGLLMEAIKPSTGIRGGAREIGSNIGLSGGVSGAQQGIDQIKKLLAADYGVAIDALESAYGKSPVKDQYRQKFTATKKTKTPPADGETKQWNGKTYKKQGDRWVEVK